MTDDRSMAGDRPVTDDCGTLYVVGIGPGLPEGMTRRAARVVSNADCVIAADLYQRFLREDGTLPPENGDTDDAPEGGDAVDAPDAPKNGSRSDGPEVIRSTMGRQAELAREAFERVRAGQDVVHVSGGDPNVYGKSDLLFGMATAEDATDVPIEVVPGVTAGLGGAAGLGAPLSNDFCTVSLSDRWRPWEEIEGKLRAATAGGFVLVLYNPTRNFRRAIEVVREERADDVPVAIVTDVGRGDHGSSPDGERYEVTTLGEVVDYEDGVSAMGTLVLVGTSETEVWEAEHRSYLVTPRGERDVAEYYS